MTTTRKITDSTVASVSTIPDTALVAVFDPTTGKASKSTFAALKLAVRDSIQIGGRNLLMSEIRANGNCSYADGVLMVPNNKDTFFQIKLAVAPSTLKIGEPYTISFDCDGMLSGNMWEMSGGSNKGFNIKMVNGRNHATFLMTTDVISGNFIAFDDGKRSFPEGFAPITLSKFKLEEGNMATAWTPAPEDQNWGG